MINQSFQKKILPLEFFNQPTLKVARALLGKFLIRRYKEGKTNLTAPRLPANEELMITEVEAYDGFKDKASHASRGRTERNKIMFGPAGYWYVYFTYGLHWMLNIVTGPKNYPAAILIRGTKQIIGPARITKHLKIDLKFNGLPASKKTGLWIEDRGPIDPRLQPEGSPFLGSRTFRGVQIKPRQIVAGKRIGVEYAGQWANKPYRFKIKD